MDTVIDVLSNQGVVLVGEDIEPIPSMLPGKWRIGCFVYELGPDLGEGLIHIAFLHHESVPRDEIVGLLRHQFLARTLTDPTRVRIGTDAIYISMSLNKDDHVFVHTNGDHADIAGFMIESTHGLGIGFNIVKADSIRIYDFDGDPIH